MSNYITSGPEDTSGIPHVSLGKIFHDAFNTFDKNNIAMVDGTSGKTLTYEDLLRLGKNLAASFRLLGITKNDIIALVAENSREFLVVYMAALFLAVPLHLINPKLTKYEMDHILNLSKPILVLCTEKSHLQVAKVTQGLDFVNILIQYDVEKNLKNLHESGDFQIEENIDSYEHVAVVCNSSGTTGLPKGVMLSHESLRLTMTFGRHPDFYDMKPGKNLFIVSPFFHIYGLIAINATLVTGGTLVFMDHFKPETYLQVIQKHKVQLLWVVPTLINFLIKSPMVEKYDLSYVKEVQSGGSLHYYKDLLNLTRRLNLKRLHVGYGLTEAGMFIHQSNRTDGSVGTVISTNQVKVADLQNGRPLPPFENGEICVKGNLMVGYIKNVEQTKAMMDADGFLHTGDVGHYDQNGVFFITGRIKEIIKFNSYQVPPNEIENVLRQLKEIKDVAVVGKPDPRYGELPIAFVVIEDGARISEQRICDFLMEFVSKEKRLHGVRFVDSLPRNSMGKIMRHDLIRQLD